MIGHPANYAKKTFLSNFYTFTLFTFIWQNNYCLCPAVKHMNIFLASIHSPDSSNSSFISVPPSFSHQSNYKPSSSILEEHYSFSHIPHVMSFPFQYLMLSLFSLLICVISSSTKLQLACFSAVSKIPYTSFHHH